MHLEGVRWRRASNRVRRWSSPVPPHHRFRIAQIRYGCSYRLPAPGILRQRVSLRIAFELIPSFTPGSKAGCSGDVEDNVARLQLVGHRRVGTGPALQAGQALRAQGTQCGTGPTTASSRLARSGVGQVGATWVLPFTWSRTAKSGPATRRHRGAGIGTSTTPAAFRELTEVWSDFLALTLPPFIRARWPHSAGRDE